MKRITYVPRTNFDMGYQVAMHLATMMQRWPKLDAERVREEIRRELKNGDCWLWPEPKQLELWE